MADQPLLSAGLRKTIGMGQSTLVWADPWVPTTPARPALPCGPSFNPALRVSDLIDPITKDWKHDLLSELIDPNDLPLIRSLKPTRSDRGDSYCWTHTKSGSYSVRTGYTLTMEMMERPETKPVLEPSFTILQAKIWKLKTTKKIKHFIWQALSNCVPVCSSLSDRHCGTDRNCPRCGADEETRNHLLFECPPGPRSKLGPSRICRVFQGYSRVTQYIAT